MKNKIPEQLQNEKFRFYLVSENSKVPVQPKWNTVNNHTYTNIILLNHLRSDGNYGVVTGYGNLIVLDFDSEKYYLSKKNLLSPTFTIRTALSRLPHYYYILKGEPISKVGIDDETGKRVCDIQSNGAGIVAPNSCIDRKYYDVVHDLPIKEIRLEKLVKIFKLDEPRKAKMKLFLDKTKCCPEKVKESINYLKFKRFIQIKYRHFRCPLHEMKGSGNLYVGDTGSVYCFHCKKYAKNAKVWIKKYNLKLVI